MHVGESERLFVRQKEHVCVRAERKVQGRGRRGELEGAGEEGTVRARIKS